MGVRLRTVANEPRGPPVQTGRATDRQHATGQTLNRQVNGPAQRQRTTTAINAPGTTPGHTAEACLRQDLHQKL